MEKAAGVPTSLALRGVREGNSLLFLQIQIIPVDLHIVAQPLTLGVRKLFDLFTCYTRSVPPANERLDA